MYISKSNGRLTTCFFHTSAVNEKENNYSISV